MFTQDVNIIGNPRDGGFLIGFLAPKNTCTVIRQHGEECYPAAEMWSPRTIESVLIESLVDIEKFRALTNENEIQVVAQQESHGFNNITEELYYILVSALQKYHERHDLRL